MMKRLKSDDDDDTMDRLPESLIFEILPFLETRDVVRTISLVSKGWKDLWTTIPYLYFNDSDANPVPTLNLINGVLRRWKGTRILGFKILLGNDFYDTAETSISNHVPLWVGFATEKKVEDLDLELPFDARVEAPECLYSCSSITKLRLYGLRFPTERGINRNVRWDRLKSLEIFGKGLHEELLQQLVSSAPQLQVLDTCLSECRGDLSIRSSCLKRVTLYITFVKMSDPPISTATITICAPNLEELSLYGFANTNSRFVLDVPALTDANIGSLLGNLDEERLNQLLQPILHVEALSLPLSEYNRIIDGKWLFWNVKILEVFYWFIEPKDIVGIAVFFPKVEKIVVEYSSFFVWSPCDGVGANKLLQLRTVEVLVETTGGFETAVMFQLIDCLLKHAIMLQKIVIRKIETFVHESDLAAQQLLDLQSSFPTLAIDLTMI